VPRDSTEGPRARTSALPSGLHSTPPHPVRQRFAVLSTLLLLTPLIGALTVHAEGPYAPGLVGHDISWPQCDGRRPATSAGFEVIGVTGGRPFTVNPCLADEVRWAKDAAIPPSLYLNVDFPVDAGHLALGAIGPAGVCSADDMPCVAYNYGYRTAIDGMDHAAVVGVSSSLWWLDVELGNNWSDNTGLNARDIQGVIDSLHARRLTAGVYSAGLQWRAIAGGYRPGVPQWTAGATDLAYGPWYCGPEVNFTGGPIWITQYYRDGFEFDGDYSCGKSRSYWVAGADGGVFSMGSADFHGGLGGSRLAPPVAGMAATPSGGGYWLAGADGGIFAFGDAGFHGGLGGRALNAPIVGIATTPDGRGYWLAAADGGVFAFGDARFHGGLGGRALNAAIVGIAATPDGGGYWLASADGGIFAFGDATYAGNALAMSSARVSSIAASPDGRGYWLAATDGGVFAFGDAPFWGSAINVPVSARVVSIAATQSGRGYWLLASDGHVYSFSDAPFFGGAAELGINGPAVAVVEARPPAPPATPTPPPPPPPASPSRAVQLDVGKTVGEAAARALRGPLGAL
jgi:hypothetical protein